MKKNILTTLVILSSIASGFAQGKTPAAATTTFSKLFPDATNVKWGKENDHNYEAEFKWKGVSYSANFSDKGEWLETESPFTFIELPEKVQQAYNTAHKGATVKEVAKIETSKQGTIYEVEMKQGMKTVELFYKSDGTETKE